MRVLSTPFRLPKAGNRPDECEDAYHPAACGEYAGDSLRFAVADGATEGLLSAQWADLLVKLYKRRWQDPEDAPLWLDRAYNDWERLKANYIHQRAVHNRPIQWYEEPGLAEGAFSTLLGLTLREGENEGRGTFEAVALGDSCLFQVADDELRLAFPLTRSDEFNDRPLLFSSNPARNYIVLDNIRLVGGEWQGGDRFYLLTDALAAWFLRQAEAGEAPWHTLAELSTSRSPLSFSEWIQAQRAQRELRNDDVTCVQIQVM